MLIKSDYRVFESVAGDDSRLTLTCVNVTADREGPYVDDHCDGLAMATDGFILAVVPVKVEYDDDIGLISASAFKAAFDASKRMRLDDVLLKLDLPDYVGLADGGMVRRYDSGDGKDLGRFPDVTPVIPKRIKPVDREAAGLHLMAANFNYGLMLRLIKSIGCKWSDRGVGGKGDHFPRLVFGRVDGWGGTSDPIIVESSGASMGEAFVPPYGLIMPLVSDRSGDYFKQSKRR